MGAKRKKSRRKCWLSFLKRAVILLAVLFVAASILGAVGWEAVSALGIVKEAVSLLAEAAADAFGDSG